MRVADVLYSRRFCHYTDENVTLTLTDLDLLHGRQLPELPEGCLRVSTGAAGGEWAEELTDGPYAGAVVNFTLSNGAYATMCIRELLNSPTDFLSQRNLSSQHSKRARAAPEKV